MRQIALPLDELRGGASSSLIITPSNATAFAGLGSAASWPRHCAILVGPARSGKSLMARYFSGQGGTVVDDAETNAAETLFNAWNRAQESAVPLLLISRWLPADWNIALPDLKSRLGSALLLEIGAPDDEMIEQLLQKQLADRGAAITMDALSYVKRRIERSYASIESFARAANAMALAENAPVNLTLVKKVLDA
ncbi:DnaA ATPase domain-containing protein [Sphingorhabdus contaminans]|uniref:ATPase n=1 Tax=Sphingorhabdus contaminans TaxID=1343899 RepID=A0A553WI45_9SPHN|nr:DnaA/Hda family protein [Sphingorhabdus contaminans]TSB04338.1 ATPase [Sphingorhabdus contaminans]